MIVDKFQNIRHYSLLLNNLEAGLQAIEKLKVLEVGKYEFNGGFFMVQEGSTKPMAEGNFEAHKKYVDVQIVLEGSEDVAWAETMDLQEEIPYNEEKDATYYSGETNSWMNITAGMCYVAYPHDGHKAIRHVDYPQKFKKIVMKLLVKSD